MSLAAFWPSPCTSLLWEEMEPVGTSGWEEARDLPRPRNYNLLGGWGSGGNVPNMASVLRASREQRVQTASRAGGPADDNLFHGSYAYGTASASESTGTFPGNKQ